MKTMKLQAANSACHPPNPTADTCPMRVSVIVGNPRPQCFCHAIAKTAAERLRAAGRTVILHDLQQESFNPVATAEEVEIRASKDPLVEHHCAELAEAEG